MQKDISNNSLTGERPDHIRLFINGRFLTQRRTGVERYAYELCRALHEQDVHFTIICPNRPIAQDYDVSMFDIVTYGVGASHFWEQCVLPFFFVGKKDYVVISFTGLGSILIPNKVMTVHDLSFLYNPKWFSKAYYYYYKLMTPIAVRTSKGIITVSDFSRQEILRFYPFLDKSRIHVVYNACNPSQFASRTNSESCIKSGEERYALAVSSIDPRKNLDVLIKAFADGGIGCRLYVVGNHNRVFAGSNVKTDENNVVFLGRVNDAELSSLYANAQFFVSSSLYEGFGLPLLESMTSRCPVLCSDIPVYKEVCEDSAIYFAPTSPESLRDAVSRFLAMSEEERKALYDNMERNLKRFSWSASALKVRQIVEGCICK